MTTPLEALADLLAAARTVAGLTADAADKLGSVSLPAVLVGAPSYIFEGYCPAPTGVEFPVTLLVRLQPDAIVRLLGFVGALSEALEADTPAVVTGAVPLSYDLGNQVTAAAYELTVSYPL